MLVLLNAGSGVTVLRPQARKDNAPTLNIQSGGNLCPVSAPDDINDDGIDGFVSARAMSALVISVVGLGLSACPAFVAPPAVEHVQLGWVLGRGCQSNC